MAQSFSALRRPCELVRKSDDVEFKVCEAIHLLKTAGDHYDFFESAAIVRDATVIVDEATINAHLVPAEDLAQLQVALRSSLPNIQKGLNWSLDFVLECSPPVSLTRETLESWYHPINTYLDISHELSDDLAYNAGWTKVREAITARYESCKEQLAQGTTEVHKPLATDEKSTMPAYPPPTPSLAVLIEHAYYQTSSSTVQNLCAGITDGLRYWCSLAESSDVDDLFRFLHHFKVAAEIFFVDDTKTLQIDTTCRNARHVQILQQGWCRIFALLFGSLLQDNLAYRYENLIGLYREQPKVNDLDLDFTTLAIDLDAIMVSRSLQSSRMHWISSMPNEAPRQSDMHKLQATYEKYQAQSYYDNEFKRTWLLLWQCLRLTHGLVLDGLELPLPACTMEDTFFNNGLVQGMLNCIWHGSEVLCSSVIENLVTEYCVFFARAVKHSNDRMFAQYQGEIQVSDRYQRVMYVYLINQRWHPDVIHAMRDSAARLNYLTAGPAYVRRALQAAPAWFVDRLDSDYVDSPSPRDSGLSRYTTLTNRLAREGHEHTINATRSPGLQHRIFTPILTSIGKFWSRCFRNLSRRATQGELPIEKNPRRKSRYDSRLRKISTGVAGGRISKPARSLSSGRRWRFLHGTSNLLVAPTRVENVNDDTPATTITGGISHLHDLTEDQQLIVMLLQARLAGSWPGPDPPRDIHWIVSKFLVPHYWDINKATQAIRRSLASRIASHSADVNVNPTCSDNAAVPRGNETPQKSGNADTGSTPRTEDRRQYQALDTKDSHHSDRLLPQRSRSAPPGLGQTFNASFSQTVGNNPEIGVSKPQSPCVSTTTNAADFLVYEDSAEESHVTSESQGSVSDGVLRSVHLSRELSDSQHSDRSVLSSSLSCGASQCHRCPVYPGAIHHICPITTSPAAPADQHDQHEAEPGNPHDDNSDDRKQTSLPSVASTPGQNSSAIPQSSASSSSVSSQHSPSPTDRVSQSQNPGIPKALHSQKQPIATERTMVTRDMARAKAQAEN